MFKKLLSIAAVMIVGLCLLCGCKPKPVEIEEKPFYTLEEAYSYGWLKKKDLKSIAELVNHLRSLDIEELDSEVLAAIKESYATLRNVETDEVIVTYYGKFNEYYAVGKSVYGDVVASVMVEVEVGGVKFFYPNIAAEVTIFRVNEKGEMS